MSRNIAKPFRMQLSLIETEAVKHKYKCFFGEHVEIIATVIGEDLKPVDLTNMSVKTHYILSNDDLRQDDNIFIDEDNSTVHVFAKKGYIRVGTNTIRIVLYDDDQEVILQPITMVCMDPNIKTNDSGVIVPPELDVRSEMNLINKNISTLNIISNDNKLDIDALRNKTNVVESISATKNEVDIERKRINNLTTLPNGSTVGDAELIDGRVSNNGVTHVNIGTNLRESFKNVNGIILPSNYVDLTTCSKNNSKFNIYSDYERLTVLANTDAIGHGGTSVIINEGVNEISFDIEVYNFGINCGIYYYTGNTLKKPYVMSSGPLNDVVYSRSISYKIDWDKIRSEFSMNGYDNIKLIIWNVTGAKSGGYNKITNFKSNGSCLNIRKNVDNLASKVNNLTIPFDRVSNEDVQISNVDNITSWGTSNLTIKDGIINMYHRNTTGNTGCMNQEFTSITNFVIVEGQVDSIIRTDESKYQVLILGYKKSNGATVYCPAAGLLTDVGDFKIKIDLNYYVVYSDLDLNKPVRVLIGSVGVVEITISNLRIYENQYDEYDLIGRDLSDSLININNAINMISNKNTEVDKYLVSPNGSKYTLQISDDGVIRAVKNIPNKTLVIGNSLLTGFSFGMCATDSSNDFYYHLTQYIKSRNQSAVFVKRSGSAFEQTETDSAAQAWISSNVVNDNSNYDLIIVQLGDNVNNSTRLGVFRKSCVELLRSLRVKNPSARVCWVGEWYHSKEKQDIIAKSCDDTGSIFIDITDLRTRENEGSIGDVITRDDGTTFIVDSSGVASHPGNKGMLAIANRIIEELF